ncbi:MAG: glycosyltransferase family A protein [Candidatus Acidiferrales bacterium]
MLTIFALPKPFLGHFDIIQRNAIRSWMSLLPRCEIILLGDDQGTAEVAQEFGLRHVSAIERNEFGTPLLNAVFGAADEIAKNPWLCYVNADIILMSSFVRAVQRVATDRRNFLLVGGRWDMDITEPLPFDDGWEEKLKARVATEGRLRSHGAVDYFVFPRGMFGEIPPFAIGRTLWDQWLIYRAASQDVPVIDLTEMVQVVHQNHNYGKGRSLKDIEKSPEGRRNFELAGGYSHAYNLWDTQFKFTRCGIKRRRSPYFFYRQLVKLSDRNPLASAALKMVRVVVESRRS